MEEIIMPEDQIKQKKTDEIEKGNLKSFVEVCNVANIHCLCPLKGIADIKKLWH